MICGAKCFAVEHQSEHSVRWRDSHVASQSRVRAGGFFRVIQPDMKRSHDSIKIGMEDPGITLDRHLTSRPSIATTGPVGLQVSPTR